MVLTTAILPIRFSFESKHRLRNILNQTERQAIVKAMLTDTIQAVRNATLIDQFVLLTPDEKFLVGSSPPIFEVHHSQITGLNEELTAYTEILLQQKVQNVLIILPDLPLLTGTILDGLISSGQRYQRPVIAPDWKKSGTNVLFLALPTPIRFSFGYQSLQKHIAGFNAAGLKPIIYHSIETALDIDDEAALQRFFLSAKTIKLWQATTTYRTFWVNEKRMGKAA